MMINKTNTQAIRKADINFLERRLIELQEKYNLADESIEKVLLLAQ